MAKALVNSSWENKWVSTSELVLSPYGHVRKTGDNFYLDIVPQFFVLGQNPRGVERCWWDHHRLLLKKITTQISLSTWHKHRCLQVESTVALKWKSHQIIRGKNILKISYSTFRCYHFILIAGNYICLLQNSIFILCNFFGIVFWFLEWNFSNVMSFFVLLFNVLLWSLKYFWGWVICWCDSPLRATIGKLWKRAHTLIQGWFMNCPIVILSLGFVFSNWMMSCFAAQKMFTSDKTYGKLLYSPHYRAHLCHI